MIVNLMDCMLQNLPGLFGVFRIHHNPVLESLYLEIPLLLITHPFQNRSSDSIMVNKLLRFRTNKPEISRSRLRNQEDRPALVETKLIQKLKKNRKSQRTGN